MGHEEDEVDIDDGMKCIYHPYRKNQEGICSFCLQEKLGKLVSSSSSSSSSLAFRTSSSSSSSSFRSDINAGNPTLFHDRKTRIIPSLLPNKNKKKLPEADFKRSKSITTPGSGRGKFVDHNKKWVWSLFDVSSSKSTKKINSKIIASKVKDKEKEKFPFEDDGGEDDDDISSFERKVSRSRSVGCGSRSFSGDFFERISTGFGDCTLRRVESQREGKSKPSNGVEKENHQCLKERVKCGGIFGGFMINTSSSSSSASSSYWVSSGEDSNGKVRPSAAVNGRNKNKGYWTFASPMRVLGKRENNRETSSEDNNSTTNLEAVPSLLAVRI